MSRVQQLALAVVVGATLLVVALFALDHQCVVSHDRDLPCRAVARALQLVAPARY